MRSDLLCTRSRVAVCLSMEVVILFFWSHLGPLHYVDDKARSCSMNFYKSDCCASQGVHCLSTVNIHVRAEKGYYLEQACTKCTYERHIAIEQEVDIYGTRD